MNHLSAEFTVIGPVRRPKGMYIMQCPSNDGYKTRAARLIGDGLNCSYSRQAGGYVVSPSKLEKFKRLLAANVDACVITGKLYDRETMQDLSKERTR